MTVELTEKMITAIRVSFDELSNSGSWTDYLDEEVTETVYEGMTDLEELLSEF